MLSKSSKYAIRAVLYLSLNSNENQKYSPQKIAEMINIPAPFLAKTLQELTKRNIISSSKGRNGGFYLTKADKLNPMLSIVDCIDGLDKFNDCFLGLPKCDNEAPCVLHKIIYPFKNKFLDVLSTASIEDFSKDLAKGTIKIV
jgi:Rrf2 family iron-sulfur cluster assembly transcriptional regulator